MNNKHTLAVIIHGLGFFLCWSLSGFLDQVVRFILMSLSFCRHHCFDTLSVSSQCAYLGDMDTPQHWQLLLPFLSSHIVQRIVDLPSSGHQLELSSFFPLVFFLAAPCHGEFHPYYIGLWLPRFLSNYGVLSRNSSSITINHTMLMTNYDIPLFSPL